MEKVGLRFKHGVNNYLYFILGMLRNFLTVTLITFYAFNTHNVLISKI